MTPVPQRPRILVLTTIPQTMAAFLVPQLRSLAEAGFDVHAVSSPGAELDRLPTGSNVARHGVPIERQPSPAKDAISLWRLFRLMRQLRPQIVHAHTPKAGLVGMAAAKLAGVPVRLYTVHGLPLITRQGLWRRVLEGAERTCAALATRNYAVSESVRELLVELRLCPSHRVTVLGDGSCAGVDIHRFRPSAELPGLRGSTRGDLNLPADAVVVTFVGRFARDKGIAVLSEAWPALARAVPNLHLLMAGEEDHSDPVPAEALRALQQHERVHFTGTIAQRDMPAIYAATDIAVLPTFREGLPQTALEAAAAGVPMVSTRVSGVVNAVQDGVTGILVASHQAAPLCDAIRELALDPARRGVMGQAARTRAVEKFSEQRMNRLWMAEYLHLAELLSTESPLATAAMPAGRPDAY